jgi:hypothetical protein
MDVGEESIVTNAVRRGQPAARRSVRSDGAPRVVYTRRAMKGNIPIPELPIDEELWLVVSVQTVREGRTRQGKPFFDALAANSSGRIALKVWQEAFDDANPFAPGLYGVTGKRTVYQDQSQFVVARYRPITLETYREQQGGDPPYPRAYTLDIETLALPGYRDRVPHILERNARLGKMRIEQIERYAEDPEAEIEMVYGLGSLAATSGRVVSLAVHVGPTPEFAIDGLTGREFVFGIDERGAEQPEREALAGFIRLVANFDRETDELVGHNIVEFDLPFIFQRCVVNDLAVPRLVNLGDYKVGNVYDTMRAWWMGAKRHVSLDDVAWALGFESSKTEEVEGSRVFELYHAGNLAAIREYNLNDVRLTRRVYERLVRLYGR